MAFAGGSENGRKRYADLSALPTSQDGWEVPMLEEGAGGRERERDGKQQHS